jgi:hypothetical protein
VTVGAAEGEVRTVDNQDPATKTDDAEPAPADGLIGHATGWIEATRERARSVTHLALAEARLAALSVVMMAFFGMLAAMCLLGAWGLLVAGVAYALVQAGMSLWVALLLLGAGHLLLAWLLWRSAMRLTRHLEFAATRARIRPQTPGAPS